jgi:hypothetical protein
MSSQGNAAASAVLEAGTAAAAAAAAAAGLRQGGGRGGAAGSIGPAFPLPLPSAAAAAAVGGHRANLTSSSAGSVAPAPPSDMPVGRPNLSSVLSGLGQVQLKKASAPSAAAKGAQAAAPAAGGPGDLASMLRRALDDRRRVVRTSSGIGPGFHAQLAASNTEESGAANVVTMTPGNNRRTGTHGGRMSFFGGRPSVAASGNDSDEDADTLATSPWSNGTSSRFGSPVGAFGRSRGSTGAGSGRRSQPGSGGRPAPGRFLGMAVVSANSVAAEEAQAPGSAPRHAGTPGTAPGSARSGPMSPPLAAAPTFDSSSPLGTTGFSRRLSTSASVLALSTAAPAETAMGRPSPRALAQVLSPSQLQSPTGTGPSKLSNLAASAAGAARTPSAGVNRSTLQFTDRDLSSGANANDENVNPDKTPSNSRPVSASVSMDMLSAIRARGGVSSLRKTEPVDKEKIEPARTPSASTSSTPGRFNPLDITKVKLRKAN